MARNEKNTRMCAGCRERKDRSLLVRIYKTNDGSFGIDTSSGHSEGRGAYVCSGSKCIENALKRKSFSRSFRCELPSYILEDLINIAKSQNLE